MNSRKEANNLAIIEEDLVKGIIRNLSRLIILWLLSYKPYSGYAMLKEMQRVIGQDFRPGVIYPLLYELEEGKYIVGEKAQKGRRLIIYYSITDKGKELLKHLGNLFKLPIGSMLQEFLGEESKQTN